MRIKRDIIKVYDMTCTSCEKRIDRELNKIDGVINVMSSYRDQQVNVEYDSEVTNKEELKKAIKEAGYSTESSNNIKIVGIFIVVAAILLMGNSTSGFDMSAKLNNASYMVLFVVGILTSIHCVGMCGGIMLTQSLSKNSIVDENQSKFKSLMPSILYNAGRVTSYTIIGGIVGALGSVLSLSLDVKAGLQIFAGLFMVIMGLNMAGFSIFRRFNIKLPWSSCKVKNKPKAPFLVGMLNGLMPCGPLQTMQLYALGTGSALSGALSMLIFSLGTVPLMLMFGALSGILSKGYTKQLLKFSGILVIVLGIIMGNRGLALAGVSVPSMVSNMKQSITGNEAQAATSNITKATIENGVQIIRMTADNNGYTPNAFYVQKDMPVKWIINGDQLNSCNNSVVVPSFNIQKNLKSGENIIEFTPGDEDINFSCWMGMIRGVIKVTDNLDSVDTTKADTSVPAPSSGMSCCTTGGGNASTAPQTQSIYGDDLSKVSTDRLIKKASISGNSQSLNIKGTGYEFEPLVIVVEKAKQTKLSIDLKSFDNSDGEFIILNAESGEQVSSFIGKKDIVNVEFNINKSGTYLIIKDNIAVLGIEVTDSLENADLEKVRDNYLSN